MTQNFNDIIEINGRKIGKDYDPFIVAEMSANHKGNINTAFEIIRQAKDCGADAVKIQTYRPETITIDHNGPEFFIKEGLWKGRKLFELYEEAHTPWDWHESLFEYAKKIGITLFSSPFDDTAVDFLEKLNNPIYKVASPELIDTGLIRKIANTGKPIIFSTGMATDEEIGDAIEIARKKVSNEIVVLHCTAAYPAPLEESNLSTINAIQNKFNVLSGLSDHTKGTEVSKLAAVLGASVIEKHFTLNRLDNSVDSQFSIEPKELKELVCETRKAAKCIGKPAFKPTKSERVIYKNRRSLYIVKDVKKGEKITKDHIKSIRPGLGELPKNLEKILGNIAIRDLNYGEPFKFEMIHRNNN